MIFPVRQRLKGRDMSKYLLIFASLLTLSLLTGCVGPKPEYRDCGGNNCHREHSDSGLVS
jgi:hypothetical protein